jgi:molybdenum cofactor guanylyltransferase
VLCGGRSQRMGRPKALLPWFGRTLIEHVVATLAPCVDETIVVTSRDFALPASIEALGVRLVVDSEPARGPLAALRDGLRAARSSAAFVTSTDAPFLTPEHVLALFELAERAERDRAGGAPLAVVPRAEEHLQVLSAVYPRALVEPADALLAVGDASPAMLLARTRHLVVEGELASFAEASAGRPAPWTGFNTPAEYLALARVRDPRACARLEWWPAAASLSPPTSSGVARAAIACEVPIGLLGEVLQALPREVEEALDRSPCEIALGGIALGEDPDLSLPVGPGERVSVRARG